MGGKKQFDKQTVLDKAMKLYWTKGVEATTLSDLEKATGLKRGSIYNTFGDKDGLFLEALDHYSNKIIAPMAQPLKSRDAREAVKGLLDALLSRFKNKDLPTGCLITGTSMEYNTQSGPVKRKVSDQISGFENALYKSFIQAQKTGQYSKELDPRAVARFIMAIVLGMTVMDNVVADSTATEDVADMTMKSLEKLLKSE